MEGLHSPVPPQQVQVELPNGSPDSISGSSNYYRVASTTTLEELRQQQREQAMERTEHVEHMEPAEQAAPRAENPSPDHDGIVPDPESPPPDVGKAWTDDVLESAKAVGHNPSMQSMKSAIQKGVLAKMASKVFPNDRIHEDPCQHQHTCCQTVTTVLSTVLLLPLGVVLHDAPSPWLQKAVRYSAVLMGTMAWGACVFTASTATETGWQKGSCWFRVLEATAFMALLLGKSSSKSFQQLNAHVMKAMKSQSFGSAAHASIKCDVAVILACCASWLTCHFAKVRLVSMSGGQMTWQVYVLPCQQALYRASWALWLLRLNHLLKALVDTFCRSCAQFLTAVDATYTQWFGVTAFAGQIAEEGDVVLLGVPGAWLSSC